MWPSRAVTFVDNHDTGSSLQHWPFPRDHIEEGYCYILTHPGTPCVFYDHFFEGGLGDKIRELIKIRKNSKLNARSKVAYLPCSSAFTDGAFRCRHDKLSVFIDPQIVVNKASSDVYAATIDEKVCMKIGHGDWSPNQAKIGGHKWKSASQGKNYSVWVIDA